VDDVERPLTTGEGGPYGALAARPMPPGLAVIFMPSLAALLAEAERITGSPLTEEQVVRIRDKALVVVAPADAVAATVQQRGYAEVDAANPWESWQAIRSTDGSPLDR
jgi:hypothetical protein